MPRHKDISGQHFGRWTVIRRDGRNRHRMAQWLCRCDCGNESVVTTGSLISGQSQSCGCRRIEATSIHGLSHLREYRIWRAMMARCFCPSNNRYENYAARGITVCEAWRTFESFILGMGRAPEGNFTIERIDNDGNYEPGNCCWATTKEQARNRRSTFYVVFKGVRRSLAEHAEACGVAYKTAWKRIRIYGWSPEQALTTPTG